MDNTRGIFEPITNEKFIEQLTKPNPLVFKVGEIIEVRGSRLRIQHIKGSKIVMKLLPHINH